MMFDKQQSTAARAFSVVDLERDIADEVRRRPMLPPPRESRPTDYAPSSRAPLMDYLQHRPDVGEIGKLSAEALAKEYEEAAKEIEAMGAELMERARQCEAMVHEALSVRDEMKETASRYREEAKRIFLHIEDCAVMTAEVRRTCAALKERISAPVS